MNEITGEWIEKAEGDFKVALREMKANDPVWDAVVFHLQQCVEKYLKALFQENQLELVKVHDLNFLTDKVKAFIDLSEYHDELSVMTEFAVKAHYPGMETTSEEARKCLKTCRSVRLEVRRYFDLPTDNIDL